MRGANAGFQSSERPFTDEERQVVREGIERVYDVFLDRVIASRNLTRESAYAVSGGRVWTGGQALERGLVDGLGGLEQGLAKARQLASLNPRAPFREVRPERQYNQPPITDPASLISYAIEGLDLIAQGKTLCLSELLLLEPHN